jgi:poly(hydroxyalkanoate) depolymerase family esterase
MKWSRELKIAHRSLQTVVRAASAMGKTQVGAGAVNIAEIGDFGTNPGRLAMFVHTPAGLVPTNAPLIVLLHGCGQSAVSFAQATGWGQLANKLRIPLILPEQSGDNNQGRCFNWFRPTHVARGLGEALSIRQMVAEAVRRFGSDPTRVFIAGLSAGGAMTAALLATYPDVFAAGAVVAGLPVGAATSASQALIRMAEAGPTRSPAGWAEQVRQAAPIGYAGPWPRVSIWAGEDDRVVDPANARLLASQWSSVHGLETTKPVTAEFSNMPRVRWGQTEPPAVELWLLHGVPHAWPADATRHIAGFWGLP